MSSEESSAPIDHSAHEYLKMDPKEGILHLNHKLEDLLNEIQRKNQSLLGKEDFASKNQQKHLDVFSAEIKKAMTCIAPVVSILVPDLKNLIN